MRKVANQEFVEWEEVYAGTCYGTLRSELERIWSKGHVIVFDVDVKGGVNLKRYSEHKHYPCSSCLHQSRYSINGSSIGAQILRR